MMTMFSNKKEKFDIQVIELTGSNTSVNLIKNLIKGITTTIIIIIELIL